MNERHVKDIIDKHRGERGAVISILEDIQNRYHYLPEDTLRTVARETGRSLVDIYGVATFYRLFSLKPRGKHLISVCKGTACHVRGAPSVAGEFSRLLGIESGGTTEDNEITLETVNCMGACALGPVVVVDGHYFLQVRTGDVKDIIRKARAGIEWIDVKTDERIFPVEVSCPRCNHSLMDRRRYIDGHPSIRVTASFGTVHGRLNLSCLYGSYAVENEHPVPEDTEVDFFCPHCHAALEGSSKCPECGSPLVPMVVRGGGMLQICSRRGCKGHILDLGTGAMG